MHGAAQKQPGQAQKILHSYPGPCATELVLCVEDEAEAVIRCGTGWEVDPCDELLGRIERVLGKGSARFQ